MPRLFLASQSPRRARLLAQIGVQFDKFPVDIDETRRDDEGALSYVQRLASEKASEALAQLAKREGAVVLAADTTVFIDDKVLGKPVDEKQARESLLRLSGRTHQVATAICVAFESEEKSLLESALSVSEVTFDRLSPDDIAGYCASAEPYDKAGGYGIQGLAALFVREISGSYTGIMGLPLFETGQLLRRAGIATALQRR